jgi:hypothetical protein
VSSVLLLSSCHDRHMPSPDPAEATAADAPRFGLLQADVAPLSLHEAERAAASRGSVIE